MVEDDLEKCVRAWVFVVVDVGLDTNTGIAVYLFLVVLVKSELNICLSKSYFFEAGRRIAMEERGVQFGRE